MDRFVPFMAWLNAAVVSFLCDGPNTHKSNCLFPLKLFGYSGCDASHADYSNFQSTVENRASVIAPDLCPLDRYGYDCRCRDWFASAGEQDTYISPPYKFASTSAM